MCRVICTAVTTHCYSMLSPRQFCLSSRCLDTKTKVSRTIQHCWYYVIAVLYWIVLATFRLSLKLILVHFNILQQFQAKIRWYFTGKHDGVRLAETILIYVFMLSIWNVSTFQRRPTFTIDTILAKEWSPISFTPTLSKILESLVSQWSMATS